VDFLVREGVRTSRNKSGIFQGFKIEETELHSVYMLVCVMKDGVMLDR
jgi:hypothetical protein